MKETISFRVDKRVQALFVGLSELFDDPVKLTKGTPTDVFKWILDFFELCIANGTIRCTREGVVESRQRKREYVANTVNSVNGASRPKLLRCAGHEEGAGRLDILGRNGGALRVSLSHRRAGSAEVSAYAPPFCSASVAERRIWRAA